MSNHGDLPLFLKALSTSTKPMLPINLAPPILVVVFSNKKYEYLTSLSSN